MAELAESVAAGVIANLLTAAGTYLAHRLGDPSAKFRERAAADSGIATILGRALGTLGRGLPSEIDSRAQDQIRLFLVSPEMDAILTRLYASHFIRQRAKDTKAPDTAEKLAVYGKSFVESIFSQFSACLTAHVGNQSGELQEMAKELFEEISCACERALSIAVDNGVLSAHEAESSLRFKLLKDELECVRENTAMLLKGARGEVQAIHEFEERYRREVAERHSKIIPPQFDSAISKPLHQLFVAPSLVDRQAGSLRPCELDEFRQRIYRTVVPGDPGGGKSTLAQALVVAAADGYGQRVIGGRRVTPVMVVLRDYSAERARTQCSFVKFIESRAGETYEVDCPAGAVRYMLLNGRAFVIFDGMDELIDPSERRDVSGHIESFCRQFPDVPVFVTSRSVGYEQAPLDEEMFRVYHLAPFSDSQVEEYAQKWFRADESLSEAEQQRKVAAFIDESSVVADLRSNPLMLGLMCNLYRGRGYIPQNRPELYCDCSEMLFERWDRRRGISVPLPFKEHLRPAVMDLAF
jgi:hypothetical protein